MKQIQAKEQKPISKIVEEGYLIEGRKCGFRFLSDKGHDLKSINHCSRLKNNVHM